MADEAGDKVGRQKLRRVRQDAAVRRRLGQKNKEGKKKLKIASTWETSIRRVSNGTPEAEHIGT